MTDLVDAPETRREARQALLVATRLSEMLHGRLELLERALLYRTGRPVNRSAVLRGLLARALSEKITDLIERLLPEL